MAHEHGPSNPKTSSDEESDNQDHNFWTDDLSTRANNGLSRGVSLSTGDKILFSIGRRCVACFDWIDQG